MAPFMIVTSIRCWNSRWAMMLPGISKTLTRCFLKIAGLLPGITATDVRRVEGHPAEDQSHHKESYKNRRSGFDQIFVPFLSVVLCVTFSPPVFQNIEGYKWKPFFRVPSRSIELPRCWIRLELRLLPISGRIESEINIEIRALQFRSAILGSIWCKIRID
jgi:hypothetical protein